MQTSLHIEPLNTFSVLYSFYDGEHRSNCSTFFHNRQNFRALSDGLREELFQSFCRHCLLLSHQLLLSVHDHILGDILWQKDKYEIQNTCSNLADSFNSWTFPRFHFVFHSNEKLQSNWTTRSEASSI
jgi:hypothetical protein